MALCAGLLAGCAGHSTAAADDPDVADGSPYVATPASCAAVLPAGVNARGVTSKDTVVAARLCEDTSQPGAQVPLTVSGSDLTRLTDGLRRPSAPPKAACDATGVVLPAFVVQLADGRWVHPDVPSDGCHPRPDVVAVLRDLAGSSPGSSLLTSRDVLRSMDTLGSSRP